MLKIQNINKKHNYSPLDKTYRFTLLAIVLNSDQEVIPCAEHSQIKRDIEYEGRRGHLEIVLRVVSSPDPIP